MAVFLRVVTTGRLCAMDLHESLPKEPGDVVHGVRSEGHWFWRRWVFTADLGHPKVTHELNLWMGQAFASHFANSIMFRWVDEAGNQFRQTTRAKRAYTNQEYLTRTFGGKERVLLDLFSAAIDVIQK